MNLKEVKERLGHHNMTIKKTGYGNEHRVNFKGGKEDTAYYAADHDDAYHTGLDMAKRAMKEHEQKHWGN